MHRSSNDFHNAPPSHPLMHSLLTRHVEAAIRILHSTLSPIVSAEVHLRNVELATTDGSPRGSLSLLTRLNKLMPRVGVSLHAHCRITLLNLVGRISNITLSYSKLRVR